MGQRQYWPIFEAAVAANLPIGMHAFGYGGNAITSSGWGSYYLTDHAIARNDLRSSMLICVHLR